jgi:hypothetical protein
MPHKRWMLWRIPHGPPATSSPAACGKPKLKTHPQFHRMNVPWLDGCRSIGPCKQTFSSILSAIPLLPGEARGKVGGEKGIAWEAMGQAGLDGAGCEKNRAEDKQGASKGQDGVVSWPTVDHKGFEIVGARAPLFEILGNCTSDQNFPEVLLFLPGLSGPAGPDVCRPSAFGEASQAQ